MKRIFFFLLSISLLSACQNGEETSGEARPAGIDISDLVADQQEKDSLSLYIALNPNDVDALLERAQRYIDQSNLSYAKADVEAAMQVDSTNTDVLLMWGDIHFFANDTRISRNAWQKCIEIDPNNVDCRLKLAELYSVVMDYRKSLELVNEVIEIDPEEPVAYFIKGNNIRDMNGDTALALRYVQQAIELDPDYKAAIDWVAVMYTQMNNPLAEAYYKRLIDLDPNNNLVYYNMGMFYMNRKMYNEAIRAFTTATMLRPDDADSFFNLGYIHIELGLNNDALRYFNKSIQAREYNHRAYYGRGFAYESMGDLTRALSDYQTALGFNPQHENSRIAAARVRELIAQ